MAIFSSIPEHVAEEIMQSLPVKAIVRFKTLSKRYFSYFTSFSFIFTHYLLSSLKPSLIFPLHCTPCLVNFNISNINNNNPTTTNLVIAPPFPTSYQTRIVFCSFGLVCVSLTTFFTNVVVWNPATTEFRTLPESITDVVEFLRTRRILKICLGFGFDPDLKDYKVVRIVYCLIDSKSIDRSVQVEIFRRSTSTWRPVDVDLDGVTKGFDMEETKIKDRFPTAVVNGIIYWNAFHKEPHRHHHFIVAFDISDETFRSIPLPLACKDVSYWSVLEWDKSIATFVPNVIDQETVFDVWVMKDDDHVEEEEEDEGRGEEEEKVWVKVMSIGAFPVMTYPVMTCRSGQDEQIVMNTKKEGKSSNELIVYDMKTKQSKTLEIEGAYSVPMAHHYVESLVSVYEG